MQRCPTPEDVGKLPRPATHQNELTHICSNNVPVGCVTHARTLLGASSVHCIFSLTIRPRTVILPSLPAEEIVPRDPLITRDSRESPDVSSASTCGASNFPYGETRLPLPARRSSGDIKLFAFDSTKTVIASGDLNFKNTTVPSGPGQKRPFSFKPGMSPNMCRAYSSSSALRVMQL